MKHTHLSIILLVAGVVLTACSAPARGNAGPSPVAVTPVTDMPVERPTVTPTEPPGEPFLSAPSLANLKLLTDTQGGGAKPLLAWEAIPAADRYQLIVFDEAGAPYWAWEGAKTQVYMGGTDTQPPADSSGPSIRPGYTWAVVAYGSDGKVIAASERRPVSP